MSVLLFDWRLVGLPPEIYRLQAVAEIHRVSWPRHEDSILRHSRSYFVSLVARHWRVCSSAYGPALEGLESFKTREEAQEAAMAQARVDHASWLLTVRGG